jgi:hypothetical protein
MKAPRRLERSILLALAMTVCFTVPAAAQTTTLTITPITWNVIGLDHNNVNEGTNMFLVGNRVCNTGAVTANNVVANFVWDTNDPYINLQNGTSQLTETSIAAGACFDFYFNIEVTRNSAAYDNTRRFHVTAKGTNTALVSTPTPRELVVEKLRSQNRNSNIAISGPTTVWVGGTFQFTMDADTSTGFAQISAHTTFSNAIFQVISAVTTFSEGDVSSVDGIYADACDWEENPNDPDYLECNGSGDAGGLLHQDYWVKIIAFPNCGNGCTQQEVTLRGLIYDMSGGSFHYNENYGDDDVSFTFTLAETPTAASLKETTAFQLGSRVAIGWETEHEVQNLGYHVWREVHGQKTRLTDSLVAGASLRAGAGVPLTAGHEYAWFDELRGNESAQYWIEEVALDGTSTIHGPIPVERLPAGERGRERFPALERRSPLLEQLANLSSAKTDGFRVVGGEAPAEPDYEAEFIVASDEARFGDPQTDATPLQRAQFGIAARDAVKLTVRRDGWYRTTGSALAAAGLTLPAESRRLQLFADAREVPLLVEDGGDGKLDAADAISFYGTALDTVATDGHVYWLVVDAVSRKRITPARTPRGSENRVESFPFTVERKDRTLFFAALKNGDEDSFFGPVVMPAPSGAKQSLQVNHLDPDGSGAVLEVRLQGVTTSDASEEDHRVQVLLNGIPVGEITYDGMDDVTEQIPISASLLLEGTNLVTLNSLNGASDVSLVDRVRLTYPHTYDADAGALRMLAQPRNRVTVGGFPSPDVVVIDVSTPTSPQLLDVTTQQDDGTWSATFNTPAGRTRTIIAAAKSTIPAPAAVVRNSPSSWNDRSNRADFVIITHASMATQAQPLADRRESEGWEVAVIDVEDLFDEFSYGAREPEAIRSFLKHARSAWRLDPSHVLFLGDGSVDPRNYLGLGGDYVPVHLVVTEFSKAPWDDWFADFNNDSIADIALGRLPARSAAEATTMVNKTLAYQDAPANASMARVELVADRLDLAGGNDFATAADHFAAGFPAGYQIEKSYADVLGVTATRNKLLQRWGQGTGFVSYVGHGSAASWNSLFTSSNAGALQNGSKLPVVSTMTCLTAFFHDPFTNSLGEALLRNPLGGAVAVWGSSGLTYLAPQRPMGEAFADYFVAEGMTLGDAARKAKAATDDVDIRRTWILLGDPTLRFRVPE